eukprot:SAG22_NODE_816_length_7028_cov_32.309280_2_plen_130_part_00
MLDHYGTACFACDVLLTANQRLADEANAMAKQRAVSLARDGGAGRAGARRAAPPRSAIVKRAELGRVIAEGEYELDNLVPLCGPCNTGMKQEQAYDWCFRKRQTRAGPMWGRVSEQQFQNHYKKWTRNK